MQYEWSSATVGREETMKEKDKTWTSMLPSKQHTFSALLAAFTYQRIYGLLLETTEF